MIIPKREYFENPDVPKRGALIIVEDELFVDLLEAPNTGKLTSLPVHPDDYKKCTEDFVNFTVIDEYSHPDLYRHHPLWQGPVYAKIV